MGRGGSGLLSAFLGCPAGLHGISGISVGSGPAARPEGALWGGWCLYLKAESGEQRVAPKQHSVWKVLSLPSGRRWLMALGWRGQSRGVCCKQVTGWADSGCGQPGAPSTETLIVWLQL